MSNSSVSTLREAIKAISPANKDTAEFLLVYVGKRMPGEPESVCVTGAGNLMELIAHAIAEIEETSSPRMQ
jgi:hypothetical protein